MNMKKRLLGKAARFFGRLMYAALRRLGCRDVEVIEHHTTPEQRRTHPLSSYWNVLRDCPDTAPYETLLEFPR